MKDNNILENTKWKWTKLLTPKISFFKFIFNTRAEMIKMTDTLIEFSEVMRDIVHYMGEIEKDVETLHKQLSLLMPLKDHINHVEKKLFGWRTHLKTKR